MMKGETETLLRFKGFAGWDWESAFQKAMNKYRPDANGEVVDRIRLGIVRTDRVGEIIGPEFALKLLVQVDGLSPDGILGRVDIGGSYGENESRLSDVALDWMLRWAAAVPNGLKFDVSVLRVWPYPNGPQHDEVAAGFGFIPRWTGITWAEERRPLPGKALTAQQVVEDLGIPKSSDRLWRNAAGRNENTV